MTPDQPLDAVVVGGGQAGLDMAEPVVAQWVQTQLADRPELLAKLLG
jgi:cation diffusion facilitator CzcD-associated flavoprotein CzcO